MEFSTPANLVLLIRGNILRIRTGLWLLPSSYIGQERNEAARMLMEAEDVREKLLKGLPSGTRFLGLSDQKLIELLDDITQQENKGDCVLVFNLDLLLAYLKQRERIFFWQHMFEAMPHRPRALLLTMPATAVDLLPSNDDLSQWAKDRRLAGSVN
jgi:hypothetical protein